MIENQLHQAIAREAARIEEDSLCSSKTQWNESARWNERHYWLGVPATIAAVVTSIAATEKWTLIASAVGVISAVLAGLLTFLKPGDKAAVHQMAGGKYDALRVRARQLRELSTQGHTDINRLQTTLDALTEARENLNSMTPQASRKSWELAKKGIADGEATHEIDRTQP